MSRKTIYCVVVASIMLLWLSQSAAAKPAVSYPPEEDGVSLVGKNDPLLTAIVVVKAASGASYMADREYIATMPELKTIEEMRAFISKYEPAPQDMQAVRAYLENIGFSIAAQDNLFIAVSGRQSRFNQLLRSISAPTLTNDLNPHIAEIENLVTDKNNELRLINGMVIGQPSGNQILPDRANGQTRNQYAIIGKSGQSLPGCGVIAQPPEFSSIPVDDIAIALRANRVHQQGVTGQGVGIGFIDDGVYLAHPFFSKRPLNINSYDFASGLLVSVDSNFEKTLHSGHGTMVAAFLSAIAPNATLFSFADPQEYDKPQIDPNDPSTEYQIRYLIYMHYVVDVVSLSRGEYEELANSLYLSILRTEMVNLMSDGVVILVSAGNTGQDSTSGHNSWAAIPEVIAVGGADLDSDPKADFPVFSAAGRYDVPLTGAASFTSTLYSGRHVPDVVGIYGPDICHPSFARPTPIGSRVIIDPWLYLNPYYHGPSATSGATPQIAGIVALLKERYPGLNQTQVRGILQQASWDIVEGVSGDEEPAGPGYDLATGYGIPLADRVMSEIVTLYPGWNLIGLTKSHNTDYTADDLIAELAAQELNGNCDTVTQWINGRYESRIIRSGHKYGFNFPLELGVGYWVRCDNRTVWKNPRGTFVDTPQTVHLKAGWNFFSVPYSQAPCTLFDIYHLENLACRRVFQYNGQLQESQNIGDIDTYGYDFTLSPGQGYAMHCSTPVDWVPDCSQGAYNKNLSSSSNVYTPNPRVSGRLAGLVQIQARALALDSNQTDCAPQNIRLSNISGQAFSASWTTPKPCMGSVIINEGSNPVFRAFDDRGIRFAGTTHHVTIRGLDPNTIYSFGILSGSVWDSNNGQFYQVRTGSVLDDSPTKYSILGRVNDAMTTRVQDAVVYVQVENRSTVPPEQSTLVSFPVNEQTTGYAITLNNARTKDLGAYFDYPATTHINLDVQGGSAGQITTVLPVNLTVSTTVVAATMTFTEGIPAQPAAISPQDATLFLQPTFRFSTTHTGGQAVTYRFELSTDNFDTIAYIYDQRENPVGWSAISYTSGQEGYFTIPEPLQDLMAYQWRVFAYNGKAWSVASDIAAFSITRYQVYLPLVLRNSSGNVLPGSTPTPRPTATATPTPSATPAIPTPIAPTATSIPTPNTILISLSSDEQQGNDDSTWPSISADGRYVAFQSSASNLVPGDTNGVADVFVRDLETTQTYRVSVASDGTQGNEGSGYYTAISADGNYIAFESAASNLISGDTNQKRDVFVHDRQTGQTTRVSVASDGAQGDGDSGRYGLSISADGRYVAFKSYAGNLVSGGSCGVLVHDRQTAQTTCISIASDGAFENGEEPSISADGRYVAFEADGDLLSGGYASSRDIYVRDRQNNQTVRVSVASDGTLANNPSSYPVISSDGRYVAFVSRASNLVSDDTNTVDDIFIHDLQTQQTTRVSVANDGTQSDMVSGWRRSPAISTEGRYVAFISLSKLVSSDTDNQYDVYVRDRQTNQTICVSISSNGIHVTSSAIYPSMSNDGRYVAFVSSADDLVTGDTNNSDDVFVRDRGGIQ